jgi:peptidoglycan/LPS O-acetylase OafA/YrhL
MKNDDGTKTVNRIPLLQYISGVNSSIFRHMGQFSHTPPRPSDFVADPVKIRSTKMTIGDRWTAVNGRSSGFDYTRISLALAVAIWHGCQVAYGTDTSKAIWHETPAGYFLALILPMFFSLSGFLVGGSMYRNPNLRTFLTLRAIRIYPALVVEVVFVALVLGPLVTTVPLDKYFLSRKFVAYLFNMFGIIHYVLPGVFLKNPYAAVINSQLWTVPFELECYAVAAAIFLVGFFRYRNRVLPIFIFLTILVAWWQIYSDTPATNGVWSGRLLVLSFVSGLVLHAYKDSIPLRGDVAVIALIAGTLLPLANDSFAYISPIFVAYGTVYLGLRDPPRSIIIDSGDYSYGIYLYSSPIEQTVQFVIPHATWLGNLTISLPVTIAFALFSWWYVEKPFQKIKRLVLAR